MEIPCISKSFFFFFAPYSLLIAIHSYTFTTAESCYGKNNSFPTFLLKQIAKKPGQPAHVCGLCCTCLRSLQVLFLFSNCDYSVGKQRPEPSYTIVQAGLSFCCLQMGKLGNYCCFFCMCTVHHSVRVILLHLSLDANFVIFILSFWQCGYEF